MIEKFGEAEISEQHNDKYPCEGMECLKEFYDNGKYEVFIYNGNVVYMAINVEPGVPLYDNAIVSIGWPEKISDEAGSGFLRWNYENYQMSAHGAEYVDYFLLIPAELAYR